MGQGFGIFIVNSVELSFYCVVQGINNLFYCLVYVNRVVLYYCGICIIVDNQFGQFIVFCMNELVGIEVVLLCKFQCGLVIIGILQVLILESLIGCSIFKDDYMYYNIVVLEVFGIKNFFVFFNYLYKVVILNVFWCIFDGFVKNLGVVVVQGCCFFFLNYYLFYVVKVGKINLIFVVF